MFLGHVRHLLQVGYSTSAFFVVASNNMLQSLREKKSLCGGSCSDEKRSASVEEDDATFNRVGASNSTLAAALPDLSQLLKMMRSFAK